MGVIVEPRMKVAAAAVAREAATKKEHNYLVEERYLCYLRMKDREQVQALQQLLLMVQVSQQHVMLLVWTSQEQKEVHRGGPPVGT